MVAIDTFESNIVLGGVPVTVCVSRAADGELHVGSSDDTSVLEELLVYDLGDDVEDVIELARQLRAIGTGAAEPAVRAWNVTRIDAGPVASQLRLQLPDAGAPVEVVTLDLHDLLVRFAAFLGS